MSETATSLDSFVSDRMFVSERMAEVDQYLAGEQADHSRYQARFLQTRETTNRLTRNLSPEDQLLQSMPETSPTKWHLAHTTWFFDTFILKPRGADVAAENEHFDYLFNSYYNQVGPQYSRAQRGLISRPSLGEVWHYREAVEERLLSLWEGLSLEELRLVELGIHHEQQHQELIVTDIKHALSQNPQNPALVKPLIESTGESMPLRWLAFPPGESWFGCTGEEGFCFDNEKPLHRVFVPGFRIANRPATNAEYLAFIEDGGYRDPRHWLSEGWAWVRSSHAEAPLYWCRQDQQWFTYTLAGLLPLMSCEPVCHLNYFEASAFASWAGKRLPTEYEWELAAQFSSSEGHFLDGRVLHPRCASGDPAGPQQMFGDVWEWTRSAYLPYPGYTTPAGAVGEYNGKFMVNQWVMRGGSCATPQGHIRASYRNFFPVTASWQFSGVRLADDSN
ncbi:MAG: ergothioneine biosynthesis protein EgtB [Cellvibrionaceae bacterium]|nr:ergothioneine biosynthesis protein EgtB [Cellvibrionaceae bacterium]